MEAHEWEFFVGLTFARNVSEALARDALRAWLREVAIAAERHIMFSYVTGPQPESGRPHFHVLLSFEGAEPQMARAREAWTRSKFPTGRYDAKPYRGCESIIKSEVEYMLDGRHAEWDGPNLACPWTGECKRRHRCVVARSGWK